MGCCLRCGVCFPLFYNWAPSHHLYLHPSISAQKGFPSLPLTTNSGSHSIFTFCLSLHIHSCNSLFLLHLHKSVWKSGRVLHSLLIYNKCQTPQRGVQFLTESAQVEIIALLNWLYVCVCVCVWWFYLLHKCCVPGDQLLPLIIQYVLNIGSALQPWNSVTCLWGGGTTGSKSVLRI